ncbi:hypothetical protein MTO96_017373 [Rhipicephalus appendiculatus]
MMESGVSVSAAQDLSDDESQTRVQSSTPTSQHATEPTVRTASAETPASMDCRMACFLCASVLIVISCMAVVVLWYSGLVNPSQLLPLGVRVAVKYRATTPPVTVEWIGEPQTYLPLDGNGSRSVNSTAAAFAVPDYYSVVMPRDFSWPPNVTNMPLPPGIHMPPEFPITPDKSMIPRRMPRSFDDDD